MSALKALNLVVIPKSVAGDPKLVRREKLISQLEQQLALARDDKFEIRTKRWVKQDDGSKALTERVKRVNRWWRDDEKGGCYLVVRYGNKMVQLAPGKTAIAIAAKDQLEAVIVAVMDAVRGGELDAAISAIQGQVGRKKPVAG